MSDFSDVTDQESRSLIAGRFKPKVERFLCRYFKSTKIYKTDL